MRSVLFDRDLHPVGESRAQESVTNVVAEVWLREQQEVVFTATHDDQRRDYPTLRSQQQRVAGFADRQC